MSIQINVSLHGAHVFKTEPQNVFDGAQTYELLSNRFDKSSGYKLTVLESDESVKRIDPAELLQRSTSK